MNKADTITTNDINDTRIVIYYSNIVNTLFEILHRFSGDRSLIFVDATDDELLLVNTKTILNQSTIDELNNTLRTTLSNDASLLNIIQKYNGLANMIAIPYSPGILKSLNLSGDKYILVYPNIQQDKTIVEIDNDLSIFLTKVRYNHVSHISNLLVDAIYY